MRWRRGSVLIVRCVSSGSRPRFLHIHDSFAFLFLGKFLKFVLNNADFLISQAVELADELVDDFPWRGHLYLACPSSFHIVVSSL
jgi:hypothetical protein